jgi:hypothetical protein
MIFKRLIGSALLLLATSFDAAAVTNEDCANFEHSVAQGKAVTSDSAVFIAVSANDPAILNAKYPTKTAKRKLQSMFLKFCTDYSGYKSFQVTSRGGASGSVVCSGKTLYAYTVKKSDIIIKETGSADAGQESEIPELDDSKGLFEEFK